MKSIALLLIGALVISSGWTINSSATQSEAWLTQELTPFTCQATITSVVVTNYSGYGLPTCVVPGQNAVLCVYWSNSDFPVMAIENRTGFTMVSSNPQDSDSWGHCFTIRVNDNYIDSISFTVKGWSSSCGWITLGTYTWGNCA